MSLAISVEQLAKRYMLKHATGAHYSTLREAIPGVLKNAMSGMLGRSRSTERQEQFWALKDVSFDIREGERVGIIGRNGAGKSTLLKVLSRITEPTRGKVTLHGRVASLLEVGTGFNPELTGRENIFLNGAILGMSKREIERRFDAIVDFAGVEKFLDTPVKRYSSGMYVRLAFSVAAHIEPDILVVDEVLAVGDLQFQQKCTNRLKELEGVGRTVLFVTHNMEAMMALCDRAIVLDAGSVHFDGPAADGRKAYLALQANRGHSVENNAGRGGTGAVRVSAVNVIAASSQSTLFVGESLSFEVTYVAGKGLDEGMSLELGVGIDSEEGTRLFTSRSSWEGASLRFDAAGGSICCQVGPLLLVPGRYLISVALIHQNETLDFVQHCASFEVVESGAAGYKHRSDGFGALALPCRFY